MTTNQQSTSMGRNPFAAFEDQILDKVVGPILHDIIQNFSPSSKAEINQVLAEKYGATNVTNARLTEWLDKLGYTVEKKTVFIKPGSVADDLVPPQVDHGLPPGIRELSQ